jgi:scyllo-inositol 2-dehydrogenase (NADP+)
MIKNAIIIGEGIQGKKRLNFIKKYFNFICYVDPLAKKKNYTKIKDVPLNLYDVAFVCVPDETKKEIIEYLIKNKKHVLVEKPLNLSKKDYRNFEYIANKNKVILYTAYNHRFEQNIIEVKKILKKNILGKIYSMRFFYGNGTSKLVKMSDWKDSGDGVISDLGSHLFDMIYFLIGIKKNDIKVINKSKYENKSYDHVIAKLSNKSSKMNILIEMTYLSWKNTFKLDCICQKGSIHIDGLCKWGPSILSIRNRILPSGYPKEKIKKIVSKDITWDQETNFFRNLINKKNKTSLKKDELIFKSIKKLVD